MGVLEFTCGSPYTCFTLAQLWGVTPRSLAWECGGRIQAVWPPQIILVYLLRSVKDAALFWIVESLQHSVTVDSNEGDTM